MRVDHGTEFCLCIFVQELLKNRRHDNSRAPWRQTTSTKNYRAERLWPEENSRVNYPLKKALCIIKEQEIFNMEDPMASFAVSWLTINVSKVGSENLLILGTITEFQVSGGISCQKVMHFELH